MSLFIRNTCDNLLYLTSFSDLLHYKSFYLLLLPLIITQCILCVSVTIRHPHISYEGIYATQIPSSQLIFLHIPPFSLTATPPMAFNLSKTIFQHILPCFWHTSSMLCPYEEVQSLQVHPGASFDTFYAHALNILFTLSHTNDEFGPHLLLLCYLEQLEKIVDFCLIIADILLLFRKHLISYRDTKENPF